MTGKLTFEVQERPKGTAMHIDSQLHDVERSDKVMLVCSIAKALEMTPLDLLAASAAMADICSGKADAIQDFDSLEELDEYLKTEEEQ